MIGLLELDIDKNRDSAKKDGYWKCSDVICCNADTRGAGSSKYDYRE